LLHQFDAAVFRAALFAIVGSHEGGGAVNPDEAVEVYGLPRFFLLQFFRDGDGFVD